jgi:dTDP-4-amino-4,6-dideoxygalactose transaminase
MVATQMSVPFLDLRPSHEPLKADVLAAIAALLDTGAFTNGPQVAEFERAFADYCGVNHCVGLANGLDALRLALLGLGIQPGDEVVVPAMTFAATFEAVVQAGGVPVPADISTDDYCLDPAAFEAAVGPRTRFVIPVHLYGQLADMSRIGRIARKHDITIVEDACQAHGAERGGVRAGTAGAAAAFSFYPAKNLGAMGDAGALVSDDCALIATVRALREHGETSKYQHELVGYTARLDTVQALLLLHKLPLLDEWNNARRQAAAFYSDALADVNGLELPKVPEASSPVWHLHVVRVPRVEDLRAYLAQGSISTGRHYPTPPHLAPAYRSLGYSQNSFPVAESLARHALSLPMFPAITDSQLETVATRIREFFDRA